MLAEAVALEDVLQFLSLLSGGFPCEGKVYILLSAGLCAQALMRGCPWRVLAELLCQALRCHLPERHNAKGRVSDGSRPRRRPVAAGGGDRSCPGLPGPAVFGRHCLVPVSLPELDVKPSDAVFSEPD